jgi:hypothetical protein
MNRTLLLNYAIYNVGWFAAILGAAWHRPLTGFAIAAALTALHLWLATDRTVEMRLVLMALGCGLVVEGIQVWSGTYRFTSGTLVAWMSPPWMLALWGQFATTFRYSLRGIMTNPARAALFGFIGGPIAFVAGEGLGAVTLAQPLWLGLARLAVTWSVALWLCARTAQDASSAGTAGRYRVLSS